MDSELASKCLAVRYGPFDLSQVQVWNAEKRYADAVHVPIELRRKRKAQPDETAQEAESGPEQLSFLDLADKKRQAAWSAEEMHYARARR